MDFDGVVADSIDECLVSAHNAFTKYLDAYDPRGNLSRFPETQIKAFRSLRPLIRRGEDYVFILQAMSEGVQPETQSDFDHFLDQYNDRRDAYRDVFYGERVVLQEHNPEEWLDLNPIYPGMSDFLKGVFSAGSCFIVTTKDLTSVQMIFANQGIESKSSDLFQATRSYRKPDIINDVIRDRRLDPQKVAFVDDHVATVLEVSANTNVQSLCAEWGYNTSEQRKLVKDEGLGVLKLDQFYNQFGE